MMKDAQGKKYTNVSAVIVRFSKEFTRIIVPLAAERGGYEQ